VKKNATQTLIWAVALLLAARLTWAAATHSTTVLDTVTIGIFALYGGKAGLEHLVRVARASRQTGATR
jgi:hypothetical protein